MNIIRPLQLLPTIIMMTASSSASSTTPLPGFLSPIVQAPSPVLSSQVLSLGKHHGFLWERRRVLTTHAIALLDDGDVENDVIDWNVGLARFPLVGEYRSAIVIVVAVVAVVSIIIDK